MQRVPPWTRSVCRPRGAASRATSAPPSPSCPAPAALLSVSTQTRTRTRTSQGAGGRTRQPPARLPAWRRPRSSRSCCRRAAGRSLEASSAPPDSSNRFATRRPFLVPQPQTSCASYCTETILRGDAKFGRAKVRCRPSKRSAAQFPLWRRAGPVRTSCGKSNAAVAERPHPTLRMGQCSSGEPKKSGCNWGELEFVCK